MKPVMEGSQRARAAKSPPNTPKDSKMPNTVSALGWGQAAGKMLRVDAATACTGSLTAESVVFM
jgi:hypothetical protein